MQELTVGSRKELVQICSLAAALGAMVFLLDVIGFDIAIWLFAVAVMLICGERRPVMLALFPLVSAVLIVGGFRAMLPYPMYTRVVVGAPYRARLHALWSAAHILGSSAGCWIWILPGLVIGLAGSAMPGVAISVTMAVVLPLTLQMELMPSLVFLTSVYTGGVFGGSVPAILMNIPGHAGVVCHHVRWLSDDIEGPAQRGAGLRAILLDAVLHRWICAAAAGGRADGSSGHQDRSAGDADCRALGTGAAWFARQ